MQVMMAMLGRPPQHALLRAALRQHGKQELEGAAGAVGAVCEVAVVAGSDGKNPQPIEQQAKTDCLVGYTSPECCKASQVNQDEWNGRGIHDVLGLDDRRNGLLCIWIAHGVSWSVPIATLL
jgi:hypothetical protein